MGELPSVMTEDPVLPEGETGGEAAPSLAGDVCVLDVGFTIAKVAAFGHGIAMDSAQGVFRLAAAFALRWASNASLSSAEIFCLLALCRAFLS